MESFYNNLSSVWHLTSTQVIVDIKTLFGVFRAICPPNVQSSLCPQSIMLSAHLVAYPLGLK